MLLTARMYDILDQSVLEVTHWATSEALGLPGDFLGRAYGSRPCEHASCSLLSMAKGLYELAVELQDGETDEDHS